MIGLLTLNNMKRVSKLIFIASISFIVLCCLVHILVEHSNFEFKYGEDWFDNYLIFGVPLAISLTLVGLDYSPDGNEINLVQIISTVAIVALAVFVFLYFFLTTVLDFCGSTAGKVLYESKKKPSRQIVERQFGCGAVDSSPPSISFCEIDEYPLGLIYVTQIDTAKIDLKLWDRVE